MKPLTKYVIIGAIAFLIAVFIGIEIGLQLAGDRLLGLLFFGLVVTGMILFFMRKGKRESTMEAARKYAMDWWRRVHDEELSREDSRGVLAYFDQSIPHYGFSFKRKGPTKAGMRACIIVRSSGGRMDIADFDDNPSPEVEMDPFKMQEGYLHRSPVPLKEPLPKYLDFMPPYGRKGRRGVNINIGGPVGSSQEPPRQDEES